MKCKAVHKKLIFYIEGSLPEKEMQQIAGHLRECPECLLFSEDLKKTMEIIGLEKSSKVNPFFYTRVKAKLENTEEPEIVKTPAFVRILQPVAFSILLLLGIYTGVRIGQIPQTKNSVTLTDVEMIPFLNEFSEEPIEAFLTD